MSKTKSKAYSDPILQRIKEHYRLEITVDIHEKAERVNCAHTIEQKPAIDKFNQLYKETIERKLAENLRPKKSTTILNKVSLAVFSVLNIV